jgi:hypothetical protein
VTEAGDAVIWQSQYFEGCDEEDWWSNSSRIYYASDASSAVQSMKTVVLMTWTITAAPRDMTTTIHIIVII